MQQRRPRLGDILDDYCPRERRVTNHAVVAIVDDDVRQTRCTTCDADHEYRQAKVPTPRKAKSHAALTHDPGDGAKPVLAAPKPLTEPEPVGAEAPDEAEAPAIPPHAVPAAADPPAEPAVALASGEPAEQTDEPESADPREDDGPVHRRLIRATFPRPEGHVPERREPEFTIRQPGGRGREVDGNRFGNRGRNQRHGQSGGSWGFGSRQQSGGRGDNRQGGQGGAPNRGQRHGGGAGRKGGR